MLRELYSNLVKLHCGVQKHAADSYEREAARLLDTSLEIEQHIVETSAASLDDATVKLRLLQMEIFGDITTRQRTMLREILIVLRTAAEQAANNEPKSQHHN